MKCPNCHSIRLNFQRSRGYAGYICQNCHEWFYDNQVIKVKIAVADDWARICKLVAEKGSYADTMSLVTIMNSYATKIKR